MIADVEYTKIVYSLLFGYFLSAEIPNEVALMGGLIIISSACLPMMAGFWSKRAENPVRS
ncbi:MAG: hypothetical protein V7707_16885 [Motiliproteus sp.]